MIPYCDEVWNVTTGCTAELSCWERCWARRQAHRRPDLYGRGPKGEEFWPAFHPERLGQPLHWREPRVVLVSAMGDLFHQQVSTRDLLSIVTVIRSLPRHTWLLLTKRSARARELALENPVLDFSDCPNVWTGVSISNQADADERLPILLATPAAHRWVSYEPALGAVDLWPWIYPAGRHAGEGLDWLVAGCESGPGRRPAPGKWFRAVVEQCYTAGIPWYLKQHCEYLDGTGRLFRNPPLSVELPWVLRRR